MRGRAALLAVCCALPGVGAQAQDEGAPVWSEAPQIEAIGRARVEFPPNEGSFGATFTERAETSAEASAAVIERVNAVTAQLREAAGEDVRISGNVTLNPYYEQVTETSRDGSQRLVENEHPDALLGYVANATLDVTVLDPDMLAGLRSIVLDAGPTMSRQPFYSLTAMAEDQRTVFAAAVADARERAEVAASASGRTLGEMIFLTEGVDHCLGRASGPQGLVMVAGARNGPPPPAPPPPPPPPPGSMQTEPLAADLEPQELRATVCAIYSVN